MKELKYGDFLTIKEKEMVAEELRKSEDSNRKRQKYCKWTHVQRAEIGKHATRHGNAATVRLVGGDRQTVSDFKLAYLELKKNKTRLIMMLKRFRRKKRVP